jgi:hypothetical protein
MKSLLKKFPCDNILLMIKLAFYVGRSLFVPENKSMVIISIIINCWCNYHAICLLLIASITSILWLFNFTI